METLGRLDISQAGHLSRIVIDNQTKRNAMTFDMWSCFGDEVERLEQDANIRALILSGGGDKAFMSGADISEFDRLRSSDEGVARYNDAVERAELGLYRLMKPSIAKIKGVCVGGGVGIAVCCDIRIATPDARFAIPAAKLGLGYGHDGVQRLCDLIGPSHAADIFFTGRLIGAEEARDRGLVNAIVKAEDIDVYVDDYAEAIVANAPLSIKASKAAIRAWSDSLPELSAAKLEEMVEACFQSNDYAAGRKAFAEKKTPKFNGS